MMLYLHVMDIETMTKWWMMNKMIEITLNDKIELTGIKTSREARALLMSVKGLNAYDITAITGINKNVIEFNCYNIKNDKAYYGLLDNVDLIISLDYAGDIDDMI